MRYVLVMALSIGALSACSGYRRGEPPAAVAAVSAVPARAEPEEPDPFDHTSTSFVVSGPRFTTGETAIVKVCVAPDGIIASADLLLPSGDKRFDDFALNWARQVKLANTPPSAPDKERCGAVRVEIRTSPGPRLLSGSDSSLS
jgi:hypothetical protein